MCTWAAHYYLNARSYPNYSSYIASICHFYDNCGAWAVVVSAICRCACVNTYASKQQETKKMKDIIIGNDWQEFID